MKVQRTIALVLGGIAAGGAAYFGLSRLAASDNAKGSRSRKRSSRRSGDADVLLVRVTENGKKYHRDDCPLLHGETRVIPVSYALESYEPCKACHPPGGVELEESDLAEVGFVAPTIPLDGTGSGS
jgi:hypothetical protein